MSPEEIERLLLEAQDALVDPPSQPTVDQIWQRVSAVAEGGRDPLDSRESRWAHSATSPSGEVTFIESPDEQTDQKSRGRGPLALAASLVVVAAVAVGALVMFQGQSPDVDLQIAATDATGSAATSVNRQDAKSMLGWAEYAVQRPSSAQACALARGFEIDAHFGVPGGLLDAGGSPEVFVVDSDSATQWAQGWAAAVRGLDPVPTRDQAPVASLAIALDQVGATARQSTKTDIFPVVKAALAIKPHLAQLQLDCPLRASSETQAGLQLEALITDGVSGPNQAARCLDRFRIDALISANAESSAVSDATILLVSRHSDKRVPDALTQFLEGQTSWPDTRSTIDVGDCPLP